MSGKIRRNDLCPCGSGQKYKKCCGTPSEGMPPLSGASLPDRRLMERDLRAIHGLMAGKNFESVGEMNTYLSQIAGKGPLEWAPETSIERAQELIYKALEATQKKERVRLALEALDIHQDCTDAYVLLAEEAAETLEQARDWYRRGVEAGERVLGPEMFIDEAGHFWGLIETRPYMRARQGLADCLSVLGERAAAIEHYADMLRLNPNDNQGIRDKLLSCLLESRDISAAEALLAQFEDEGSAVWLYGLALVAFIRRGNSREAKKRLREALAANPYVPSFLLGRRRLPRTIPDYIGFGDESEAVAYVADFATCWRGTPGALEWMTGQVPKSLPRTKPAQRARASP